MDELSATVDACLELARLMTEAPRELPRELARRLCRLTGAARSDIYTLADGSLQLIAAMEGDQPETSRTGQQWRAEDWSPVALNGVLPGAAFFSAADPAAAPRTREALRRRGCRSLLWAPMCAGAQVVGAVEISDAGLLDLSRHLPVVAAFANLCAQALGLESTYEQLARRERAMQELIDLSHEIAGTHDIEGFVLDLAHRLMAAVHADDVDVWRVKDGRVTCLVSLNRDGVDPSLNGSVMHLDAYPGTASAMKRLEPFIVNDLREPTLTEAEVAEYHRWGYVSSLTMPLVAGGRLVGLVDLYDDAERDWRVHIPFLTGVLQPVAGLFDNAVLLREVEQYSHFQQALVDLSASLARAGSLEEVAVDTATRLRALSAAEDCDVWWLEEGYLRCLASVDSNGLDESGARQGPASRSVPVHGRSAGTARAAGAGQRRRPAPHRLRARALERARLPQRHLPAAGEQRRDAGHDRHLRPARARLRGCLRGAAQRRRRRGRGLEERLPRGEPARRATARCASSWS